MQGERNETEKSAIFLVEDEMTWLDPIRQELQQRYSANY
jgi:hypothetical protein